MIVISGTSGDVNETGWENRVDIGSLKGGDYLAVNVPEKGKFVTVKATVTHIKRSGELSYPACPTVNCNKKVVWNENTEKWVCVKCNKSYTEVS